MRKLQLFQGAYTASILAMFIMKDKIYGQHFPWRENVPPLGLRNIPNIPGQHRGLLCGRMLGSMHHSALRQFVSNCLSLSTSSSNVIAFATVEAAGEVRMEANVETFGDAFMMALLAEERNVYVWAWFVTPFFL